MGATTFALLVQVREQRLVVGEARNVERDGAGELGFQIGLSARQPTRKLQKGPRILPHQQHETVVERIDLGEGAIKIHAQRTLYGLRGIGDGVTHGFTSVHCVD